MSLRRQLGDVRRAIGKGVFPQQFSWLLELRARRLLLSPARLAARLRVEPDLSVLEVGAGSGFYSIDVARRLTRGRLSLVDVQPGMLQRCRAKADAAGLARAALQGESTGAHVSPHGAQSARWRGPARGPEVDDGRYVRQRRTRASPSR